MHVSVCAHLHTWVFLVPTYFTFAIYTMNAATLRKSLVVLVVCHCFLFFSVSESFRLSFSFGYILSSSLFFSVSLFNYFNFCHLSLVILFRSLFLFLQSPLPFFWQFFFSHSVSSLLIFSLSRYFRFPVFQIATSVFLSSILHPSFFRKMIHKCL
jgi:hypothetical protein